MPAPVMGRDRLAQFRDAHHRRILVIAVHDGIRRRAADVLRAGIVGKTLAEIDGVVVARKLRHRLENGDGKVAQKPCSGTVEVMERSAAGLGRQSRSLPAQHAAGQMLVVGKPAGLRGQRRRHRPLARSGRQTPPACPGDREYPAGRRSRAEPPRRRDRLRPRLHSARGHRPEDSVPRRSPSILLPASNRAPDDPPRISSRQPTSQGPQSAPPFRRAKSPLARRKSSAANG